MRERSRALWTRLGQLDPRYLVSFLITLVLVLGEARYGILGGYDRLPLPPRVLGGGGPGPSRWGGGGVADPPAGRVTRVLLPRLIKPRGGLLSPFAVGGV